MTKTLSTTQGNEAKAALDKATQEFNEKKAAIENTANEIVARVLKALENEGTLTRKLLISENIPENTLKPDTVVPALREELQLAFEAFNDYSSRVNFLKALAEAIEKYCQDNNLHSPGICANDIYPFSSLNKNRKPISSTHS